MCIWSFLLSDICQIINGHASLYIEYLSLQSPIILLAMIGCSIQYAKCISGFECTYQFAIVLSIRSKTETYYFCDNDDALLTTDSTWNSARMLFPPLEHTRFWYNVLASMAFTRLDFQNWHSRPIFMVAFSPIFWQFQRFLLDSKLGWKCLWQVGKKESCSRITRF